ncbi:aminoglycoside phosphotransferase family protein [Nocardioides zeae]|uniref:Aminoglycoside phosphotransferase family protein n=1 Tax=Nocardioides imazamoxiresistens TaxID=3231893 RepID=A0ABU3Q134_9ACTN|nr:aminoglycoside phosphotransferase family protein [Nocardioides zeae]MDT9595209.1 aminoglycoside phosphotransferase family protein [Nocardioides zeae]
MSAVVRVPAPLASRRHLGPEWADWLDRLPRRAADLLAAWELRLDGKPMHGHASLVLPVRTDRGEAAALKVGFPDPESEHEHLALGRWAGRGAVRLLRADPGRSALLLERLDVEDLGDQWDVEACEVVGELYGRLHVPAGPQLRTLPSSVAAWADALERDARAVPIPRRLVEQCLALARDLCADPASTGTLLHADLHFGNVLRSPERGWVAIDPKPVSGDRHYEPEPMLRNRFEEYGQVPGDSVRDGIRRRFHTLVDTAGLDEDRARAWTVVRSVLNAHWGGDDRDHVTRCLTIAKAVQD